MFDLPYSPNPSPTIPTAAQTPRLLRTLAKDLQQLGPFMEYLCAALDLEF